MEQILLKASEAVLGVAEDHNEAVAAEAVVCRTASGDSPGLGS